MNCGPQADSGLSLNRRLGLADIKRICFGAPPFALVSSHHVMYLSASCIFFSCLASADI